MAKEQDSVKISVPTVSPIKESIDPFLQRLSKDLNQTTGKSTYNLSGLNSAIDEEGVQTIKIK